MVTTFRIREINWFPVERSAVKILYAKMCFDTPVHFSGCVATVWTLKIYNRSKCVWRKLDLFWTSFYLFIFLCLFILFSFSISHSHFHFSYQFNNFVFCNYYLFVFLRLYYFYSCILVILVCQVKLKIEMLK